MDARKASLDTRLPLGRSEQEVWVLGLPRLRTYLRFVRKHAVGGEAIESRSIVDEWRTANDLYYDLAESEPGLAETIDIREVDPQLAPLVEAVEADSRFRRSFDTLPVRFAIVELDKLVVSQSHVNLSHVERLKRQLGPRPTPEALFRFCQPLDRREAPVKMRRTGSQRFLFWSRSSDFRFHEPALLRPEQIADYEAMGPVGAVVGLTIGYGSNFMNAVESDGRLVLNNGNHRVYAMRDLGITHAPCIIQSVTRLDELALVGTEEVCDAPAFYFRKPRPPLLKDFFDPRLRKVIDIRPIINAIELSYEIRSSEIHDFDDGDP